MITQPIYRIIYTVATTPIHIHTSLKLSNRSIVM